METAVLKQRKPSAKNSEFVSRKDGYTINPKDIVVIFDENERTDYGEDFEQFKDNIKTNGVLQNIKCYMQEDGQWHLAHGFRRMKAVLELHDDGHIIERISFDPITKNEEQILVEHFILNSGKNLTDVEAAKALKKLKVLMCTNNINDIAKRVSLPYQKVFTLLQFEENAGTAIKNSVIEGEMKFTVATTIVKENNSITKQNEALENARNEAKKDGKKNITIKHINSKKDSLLPFDVKLNMILHEARKMENADNDLINIVTEIAKSIKNGDPTEAITTFFTL
jgi:hypothetical protein